MPFDKLKNFIAPVDDEDEEEEEENMEEDVEKTQPISSYEKKKINVRKLPVSSRAARRLWSICISCRETMPREPSIF